MQESQRQRKIGGIIQEELASLFQKAAKDGGLKNTIISVTKTKVTVDLSLAKVYLSIFPTQGAKEILEGIRSNAMVIKHDLSQITKNQFRRMPDLVFYLDDSLDYIEKIEEALGGTENPIENRDLLPKRKKS